MEALRRSGTKDDGGVAVGFIRDSGVMLKDNSLLEEEMRRIGEEQVTSYFKDLKMKYRRGLYGWAMLQDMVMSAWRCGNIPFVFDHLAGGETTERV